MANEICYEGSSVIIDGAKFSVVDNWYDRYGIHYQLVEQHVVDDTVNYLAIINGKYWDKYYSQPKMPERDRVERSYVDKSCFV